MEYSLIFFGKLSPFLEEVQKKVESNDDYNCFCVEEISEYEQSIGVMAGEGQKALTLFSQMKLMAQCFEAGKSYFETGSSLGLLIGESKPMHPLISKSGSNIDFFPESKGLEHILEKIDVFFAMGTLSVEAKAQICASIGAGKFKVSGSGSNSNIIDTNSRLRIERLGFLEPDKVERKKREDAVMELKKGINIKSVDMFPRKLVDLKNPSIDRRVDVYLNEGNVFQYTETSLKKDPAPIEFLEASEEIFYPPESGMMKYFPLFAEMFGKDGIEKEVIQKLAAMVLSKEFNAKTEFYTIKLDKVHADSGEELEEEQTEPGFWTLEVPTWEDDTFETQDNIFTMPFYFDGSCHGFARVLFKNTCMSHAKAAAIEAILSSCKGVYKK